jgi:hypothetical protein
LREEVPETAETAVGIEPPLPEPRPDPDNPGEEVVEL